MDSYVDGSEMIRLKGNERAFKEIERHNSTGRIPSDREKTALSPERGRSVKIHDPNHPMNRSGENRAQNNVTEMQNTNSSIDAGYNQGPHTAVKMILADPGYELKAVSERTGLPGMTLLFRT